MTRIVGKAKDGRIVEVTSENSFKDVLEMFGLGVWKQFKNGGTKIQASQNWAIVRVES